MPVSPPRGTVVRDEYLRAGDVARLLHVSPKTVARWATEGKLPYVRTLGGHRRFSGPQIQELVDRLEATAITEVPQV
jgi:excisionase family DNA binding protein